MKHPVPGCTNITNNIWFGYCFCPTLGVFLERLSLMFTALLLSIRNVDDAGDVLPVPPGLGGTHFQ